MTENAPRKGSRLLPLTIGIAAFTGGLWLFLNAQGVGVPPFKRLWPILFLLAGAAALADYLFLSRRAGSAGWAVVFTGLGVLGFALTLDYTTWGKILDWLPSLPTILGLALLATWIADRRRSDNQVIAAGILIAIGLLGFGARFEVLKRLLPSAQVIWAVLLLLGGAYLAWRAIAQSRR
jgi:drug/metabolite transporter (DMT)-like permease